MKKSLLATIIISTVLSGCSSVPMATESESNVVKQFKTPSENTAGLYIFRKDAFVGQALSMNVKVDGKCLGATAPGVFFYEEIEGDKEHTIAIESESPDNDLIIKAESGELYFVEQFIKMGAFVGSADLEKHNTESGKKEVLMTNLAIKGNCIKW